MTIEKQLVIVSKKFALRFVTVQSDQAFAGPFWAADDAHLWDSIVSQVRFLQLLCKIAHNRFRGRVDFMEVFFYAKIRSQNSRK